MFNTLKDRLARRSNYQNVFQTNEGQSVLADLYRFCNLKGEKFVPGDSERTAYNLGKERVARYICNLLKQSEQDIEKILEAQDQHKNRGI
jgi:RNA polymerase-interacting CarD/CdnL/TRCF family regulator